MELSRFKMKATEYAGLNPYYNGRYSWRNGAKAIPWPVISLNPYYNGRYSWRSEGG